MKKQRRSVRCNACSKDFSYLINVPEQELMASDWQIRLACPYCKTKLEINLNPYKQSYITVYKGTSQNANTDESADYDLPTELPTKIIS
jgi:DNA-directed RNA polymerase subunit RPC12/RpoP